MKMYIAVLNEVPCFMVPTLVAHAVLGHHLYVDKNMSWDYTSLYVNWRINSFRKVVLRVSQKEFDKITLLDHVTLQHENNTLNAKKSCAVIVVGDEVPNVLRFAKLWRPCGI